MRVTKYDPFISFKELENRLFEIHMLQIKVAFQALAQQ